MVHLPLQTEKPPRKVGMAFAWHNLEPGAPDAPIDPFPML